MIPAQAFHIGFGLPHQINALRFLIAVQKHENVAAFDAPRLLHNPHDRAGGNAFAAAAFADQSKCRAVIDDEADAVQRLHHAFVGVKIGAKINGFKKFVIHITPIQDNINANDANGAKDASATFSFASFAALAPFALAKTMKTNHHRRRWRGSKASRSASPIRFQANTNSTIAVPGKKTVNQYAKGFSGVPRI